MRLECAASIESSDATEADIRNAMADDRGRGEFIILSETDQSYIQASGIGDGPYDLEYREGGADRHFRCTRNVTKTEVTDALLKYLGDDDTWKSWFPWMPLRKRPWWKLW